MKTQTLCEKSLSQAKPGWFPWRNLLVFGSVVAAGAAVWQARKGGVARSEAADSAENRANAPLPNRPVEAEIPNSPPAPPETQTASQSQPSKLESGGETLRDHDFPQPDLEPETKAVILDQGEPDPETLFGGGKPGAKTGDKQPIGEAPTIMDQEEATPDFAQQR